jgi:RimJ/RimL family protein N-acetyltransferase
MLPLYAIRLVLRRFTEADMEAFLVYRNDPDVARYQSWEGGSRPEAETFIGGQQTQKPGVPGQWFQVAIALKKADTLLGDCSLRVHTPDARQATIGITLARPYQGQGLATEALVCIPDQSASRRTAVQRPSA